MKAVFATLSVASSSIAAAENPLGKVLQLVDDLAAKVTKQGEAEQKAFEEYVSWCDDIAKNGQFALDDATTQKAKLEAEIGKFTGDIQSNDLQISDLAAQISQTETELQDATLVRDKEHADFAKSEAELVDVISTLDRATSMLSKEMAKHPAALAQVDVSSVGGMLQALSSVIDAAGFPSRDKKSLAAFMQAQQESDDGDLGAPAAAAYKTQSGGILEVLEDMREKAEGQLADLRKAETNSRHNFEMLKQSLSDEAKADTHDLDEEKAAKASNSEGKAQAQGDLDVTIKTLANAGEELATARSTCINVAADHESTVNSRTEELKALAEAKKILEETSSGAVAQSYSFLQVAVASRLRSRADLANSEVVTIVKQLAKKHHSAALAQLASKIAAVVKYGSLGGEDPFAKVKALVTDMIAKLEKESAAETTEKAYCDEQMSKTEAKKGELDDDVAKMTSKIDKAAAHSAELKAQVMALEGELAQLAKEQAEMDHIRSDTHAAFVQAKADLELGLGGVRQALGVLREYYGNKGAAAMLQDESKFGAFMQQPAMPEKHAAAGGAGGSIIGILEVCESDFATNLAKEESEEEDAQADYDKMTQENKVTRTSKEQDVAYKSQEDKSEEKTISDISSDRETTNTELAAVNEYYAQIQARCIAKPETYEDRKARREAEIAGLKQALTVLEDETAFVQRKHRNFRGSILSAR